MPVDVTIETSSIRLGQLLKLAGVASSGSDAKALLAAERVAVNGEPEIRRGRRLLDGDVVRVESQELRVRVAATPAQGSARTPRPAARTSDGAPRGRT